MLILGEVGGIIASARKRARLGQREVAAKSGVSRQTIDLLENGRASEIGYSKLVRILAVFGLEFQVRATERHRPTLDELLREDDGK
jgi:transcriptional regulator with XRE-family HTH domain